MPKEESIRGLSKIATDFLGPFKVNFVTMEFKLEKGAYHLASEVRARTENRQCGQLLTKYIKLWSA